MAAATPDLSAEARAELESRLRRGQLRSADDLRADFPAVWDDPEARLEVVYAEYVLRIANGESPCRDDWFERYPDLRERLERLFGLYDLLAGDDTHHPAATLGDSPHALRRPVDAAHPDGYEVLGEIGRGGMAVVYRARHLELNRVVALKVLRWGEWDGADDARRVRREAELVARLQHPNIVQVYEVGEWDGDSFLALEYVPGGTLADALTRLHREGKTGVGTGEAAALVERLAAAVQAAHEQGVIHRDLKPANVLLAADPAGPLARPKITDFGLAVSTELSPAVSQSAALVGTPCYMAPEQATARREAISPRTDVYALGGILYELLTARPPFQGATVLETLDLVRHTEPVSPRLLRPHLPRDLNTICLKCLEKDPARRYPSAAAVADDLARFRDGRPITARPVGVVEKGWKWCRRRPLLAGLAAALAVAVGLGVGGFVREYLRAEGERANAVAANTLTAERLKQIELINNSVFDIFAELDLEQVRADDQPVEAALAQKLIEAGKRLDVRAIHDPLVLANLRNRLGKTLLNLGEPAAAIDLLSAAFDVRTGELGPDHEDTLGAAADLGSAYWMAGRLGDALPLLADTLDRSRAGLGPHHRFTLTSTNNLAMSYHAAGKLDQALLLLEKNLADHTAALGPVDRDTFVTMNNLALCYHDAGRYEKALALYAETLAGQTAKLGRDHPNTLVTLNNLATTYQESGQLDKALPYFEEAFVLKKRKLGPDHHGTLTSMANLALAYHLAGQLDLALPLYEETVKLRRAKLGVDHEHTLMVMGNLAAGYQYAGKTDQALSLFAQTHALKADKLGPNHPDTLVTLNNWALCHRDIGQLDKAVPLHEKVYTLQKGKDGPDHPDTHYYMGVLAVAYDRCGRFDESEALHRERSASVVKTAGRDSLDYATAAAAFGRSLLDRRKWADAEPLLRESLGLRETKQPDHWTTPHTRSMLGAALAGREQYADAEPLLLQGYEGLKGREAAIPKAGGPERFIPEALDRLIAFYTATSKPDEAKTYRALRAGYPTAAAPAGKK